MKIQNAFLSTLLSLLGPSRAFVPSRPFRSRVSIVATKSEAAPSPSPSALREERELLELNDDAKAAATDSTGETSTAVSYIEEVAARRAASASKMGEDTAEQYIKEVVARRSPSTPPSTLRVQLRQLESILKEKVAQQGQVSDESEVLRSKLADIDFALEVIAREEAEATKSVAAEEAKRINEAFIKNRPANSYLEEVAASRAASSSKMELATDEEFPADQYIKEINARSSATRVQLRQLESILKEKVAQQDRAPGEAAALRSKLAEIDYALAVMEREESKATQRVEPIVAKAEPVVAKTAPVVIKAAPAVPKAAPAVPKKESADIARVREALLAKKLPAVAEEPVVVEEEPAPSYLEQVSASRAASASKMELPAAAMSTANEEVSVGDFLLEVAARRSTSSSKMALADNKISVPEEEFTADSFLLEVAARRAKSSSKMALAGDADEEVTVDSFLLEVAMRRANSASKMANT